MHITDEMFEYRVGRAPTSLEMELLNKTSHHRFETNCCGWDSENHLPKSITVGHDAPRGWVTANTPMHLRVTKDHSVTEYQIGVFRAPIPRHIVQSYLNELSGDYGGMDDAAEKCAYVRQRFITRGWLKDRPLTDDDIDDPRPAIREHMMENGISMRDLSIRTAISPKDLKKFFSRDFKLLWISTIVTVSRALGLRFYLTFENINSP